MAQKKQKRFSSKVIVFISLLILLSLFFTIFLKKENIFNDNSSLITPTPVFVGSINTESLINQKYHTSFSKLSSEELIDIECLPTYKNEDTSSQITNFMQKIENYQLAKNNKETQKGIAIVYESVCQNEYGYFALFETAIKTNVQSMLIESVSAAGGVSDPSNFAFITKSGDGFFVIENLQSNSKHLDKIWGGVGPSYAYFGCRTILGSTKNNILVECGSGDGGGAGRGIYFINLKTKTSTAQAICSNVNPQGYVQEERRCYDKNGVLYFKETNTSQ